MNQHNYTTELLVDKSPQEVYEAINDVYGWWTQDLKGRSTEPGDEFEVYFADVHYSRQKITELVPGKRVAWLVTDSRLNFLDNKSEWNGTHIYFDIAEKNGKTVLQFTHDGLVPAIECFRDCSNGWNYYLQGSLLPFINTGKGNPNVPKEKIER